MVPARLALRNFLCYRDSPPIDLEHVRVACLTGDNGNGKSALLDAITWALWGRARGRDGDLISLGQTEMEVEFEFFVGEARHRVIRKCQRIGSRGSTHTTLDFHVHDGAAWRVQSGSTQSETQRALLDVLKLSYETFVNSAFLMQGRADAFTVKSPGERKQVLAEILNLGQYDAYEQRAKDRRNDRGQTVAMLERQLHDADLELAKLPEKREEHTRVTAELEGRRADAERETALRDTLRQSAAAAERLQRELVAAERAGADAIADLGAAQERVAQRRATIERYAAVTAEGEAIRAAHARLADAREALRTARAAIAELDLAGAERTRAQTATACDAAERRVVDRRTTIDRYAAITAEGEATRAGYARLQAARADESAQAARLAALRRLEEQLRPLVETVERAEAKLRADLRVDEAEVERLASQAQRVDALRRERAAAERTGVELDAAEKRLASLRAEAAEQRAEIQALQSENTRLRVEIEELARKRDELRDAEKHGAAACPLCRSDLGHDGLRQVEESYEAEGRARAAAFRANRARIGELEADAQGREKQARDLEADLTRRRGEWQRLAGRLDRDLAEAERAGELLAEARGRVAALAARIEAADFAHGERAQIASLRQEIAGLGYDEAAHERFRLAATELAGLEARYQALVEAESRLSEARGALASELAAAEESRRARDEAAARMEALHARRRTLADDEQRALAAEQADAGADARFRELTEAESGLAAARAALESDEAAVAICRRRQEEAAARVFELRALLAESPDVSVRLREAEERARELSERCIQLSNVLGNIEGDIDRLEDLERATRDRRRRLAEAQREMSLYDDLVRAFGKQGAQALIIESALPEIEAAANELLARMTNNRMHVSLETQRQNLKGTVTETLDIKIADEWGTRSYEMYSGGEAFRINLALRIALSKLLARRAGAPLPTLVIDEGFGTQDAAGRERLVEAITAIQDEFQCLLLVTHIDELKDLFDTRIEVEKNGAGSVARVVAA